MGMGLQNELLRNIFSTAGMYDVFSGRRTVECWLDVEKALAEAQGELGIIPKDAAKKIAKVCNIDNFDMDVLEKQVLSTGHPLVPLIRLLVKVAGDSGGWVHWGATTQDIVDTGSVLQMRRGLQLIIADLAASLRALAGKSEQWRDAVMAGRTHMQHALPITLGYKIGVWTDELVRVFEAIQAAENNLCGQFAGAVGTLASLGDDGAKVRVAMCNRLGLKHPDIPWHTSRDRIRNVMDALVGLSIAAERIALEIVRMQSTELGEVSEPISSAHVGSSTMPQKRNPHSSEFIVAGARMLRANATAAVTAGIHSFERDMGTWAVEWVAIPETFALASGVVHNLRHVVEGMTADTARMRANLDLTSGQIMSEKLMMTLARKIGHEHAHELILAATRRHKPEQGDFPDTLLGDDELMRHMSAAEIKQAMEPSSYLGEAHSVADTAARLARAAAG
jgi:3-carboxy-cis,cis-muconate cycloisomerase